MSMKSFSLCRGAGLAICAGCNRIVDRHPQAAANPRQPFVAASTSNRCPNWMAPRPQPAITPTAR